jgi:hypothetical protein
MQLKLAKKMLPLTNGKLPFVFGLANTERLFESAGQTWQKAGFVKTFQKENGCMQPPFKNTWPITEEGLRGLKNPPIAVRSNYKRGKLLKFHSYPKASLNR